jgi:biopolymer transport protein ExbB/TolQ
VLLLLLIPLFVLLLASTVGAVYVFLRLRRSWRAFKSFGPALDGSIQQLTASVERLSQNMEAFASATPRLEESTKRLQHSLARAAVLRSAVQDARDSLGRLTAVYPRK